MTTLWAATIQTKRTPRGAWRTKGAQEQGKGNGAKFPQRPPSTHPRHRDYEQERATHRLQSLGSLRQIGEHQMSMKQWNKAARTSSKHDSVQALRLPHEFVGTCCCHGTGRTIEGMYVKWPSKTAILRSSGHSQSIAMMKQKKTRERAKLHQAEVRRART